MVTTQQSLFGVVRNVQTCPDCSGSGRSSDISAATVQAQDMSRVERRYR
ncbi:MAG: hypothetical protein ACLTDF_10645 [Coprococcus sp.]